MRILTVRADNPGWGARKIQEFLQREGCPGVPCAKTVNNILNRYGYISREESLKHKPFVRFEKDLCNQMWQVDFKGEFRMEDGRYCYPLDILDDHSRFVIRIEPRLGTANVAIPVFTEAFGSLDCRILCFLTTAPSLPDSEKATLNLSAG